MSSPERPNFSFLDSENENIGKVPVTDYFKKERQVELVQGINDDEELRVLSKEKTQNLRNKNAARNAYGRNKMVYEQQKLEQKKQVEINRRDVERIEAIKEFIKTCRQTPHSKEILQAFWDEFHETFLEDVRQRSKKYRYKNPQSIKNGILGELAAEDILTDAKTSVNEASLAALAGDALALDWGKIKLSVKGATSMEDVLEQTDLKLQVEYEGKKFDFRVQVKCSFKGEPGATEGASACVFGEAGDALPEKFKKPFKKFQSRFSERGIFMVIEHGYGDFQIDVQGRPSQALKSLLSEQLMQRIYGFLVKRLRMENQVAS